MEKGRKNRMKRKNLLHHINHIPCECIFQYSISSRVERFQCNFAFPMALPFPLSSQISKHFLTPAIQNLYISVSCINSTKANANDIRSVIIFMSEKRKQELFFIILKKSNQIYLSLVQPTHVSNSN